MMRRERLGGPSGWRSPSGLAASPDRVAGRLLLAPLSLALTGSLRRVLRAEPELLDRLEEADGARIAIQPSGWPVAFLMVMDGPRGRIRALPAAHVGQVDVRVEAPLALLLTIFEGRDDGDTAFFSSELTLDGEVAPLLALRNAIEAAGLDWTALLPLPVPAPVAAFLARAPRTLEEVRRA